MNTRLTIAAILGFAALSAPAAALDQSVALNSSQYAIGISGFVPVICHTSISTTSVAPSSGMVQLGSLNEFCNNPRGYIVHADYSPSLASARLVVDGVDRPLGTNGTAVISSSDHAANVDRSISLAVPEGVQGGSISFRIEPL